MLNVLVIEVCSGDYGNYHEKLVDSTYRKCNKETKDKCVKYCNVYSSTSTTDKSEVTDGRNCCLRFFLEFKILLFRRWLQMFRDKVKIISTLENLIFNYCFIFQNHLLLKVIVYIAVGLLLGFTYFGMANDASKILFLFGLYFMTVILFLYVPMFPMLLTCKFILFYIISFFL